MQIEVPLDVKNPLGESPLWDVDLADGRIFLCKAEGTEVRAWVVPGKVGAFALSKGGSGAVIMLNNTFSLLDFVTDDVEAKATVEEDKPRNRLNDGKTNRLGSFLAGSMEMGEEEASDALYRLDHDFSVQKLDVGFAVSNGPWFLPNDKTFYFQDSWVGEIWAYNYDLAQRMLSNKRVFATLDTSDGGGADGSTVDAEGYLWSAKVYAGKLVRYIPNGDIERMIEMLVKKVTSVNFGGPNMDVLYVTSMVKLPLPRFPEDGVMRGALFAIRDLGVQRFSETRFGA